MSYEPTDPRFREKVEASFDRQQFMRTIGARLLTIAPGRCDIELPYNPALSQQHGYFHAGIVATLADNAGGFAAFTLMPAETSVLSVEFKLNLLSPAAGDRLIGRGRVIKAGRTLTICRSDVLICAQNKNQDKEQVKEKLCATALLTMMCVQGREEKS
jgi:uncharacterized protein (TIGR00369 family)